MRAVKSAIPGAIPGMVKLKKTQTSGREPISLSGIWSTAYNAVYFGGDPPCRDLAYSLLCRETVRTEFIWETATFRIRELYATSLADGRQGGLLVRAHSFRLPPSAVHGRVGGPTLRRRTSGTGGPNTSD